MNNQGNTPDAYLWVLRALTTAFLLGYLVSIYLAVVVSDLFPAENRYEDLLALGLLLLFAGGYYLMWINREGWAAILFILWYACLWGMKIWLGGLRWEDGPVPGIILFILAILIVIRRFRIKKAYKKGPPN